MIGRIAVCVLLAVASVATSVAHAEPTGHVTFRGANGHVYRIATQVTAVPEDISVVLDGLAPGGGDAWLATSRDGSQLLLETERWDTDCLGWACLAVVRGDLAKGGAVHAGGAVVHAEGFSAVTHDARIVYPAQSQDHALDLWRLDRAGPDWAVPVRLTAASPYAYNSEPALSADETRVVFDCGNQPYGAPGTALCEVGIDGSGLRVILAPSGAQPEFAGARALGHGSYAADGSVVFAADPRGTQIWRMGPTETSPVPVGQVFDNDNSPCVLPNGTIASLWYAESGGATLYQLKVMQPSDHTFVIPPAGDLAHEGIGCSA